METYTCNISGKEFESKEALFKHYMEHYVTYEKSTSVEANIRNVVLSAFPDCLVSVIQSKMNQHEYDVDLTDLPYSSDFFGIVSPTQPTENSTGALRFRTPEELVAFLKDSISKAEAMVETLRDRFQTDDIELNFLCVATFDEGPYLTARINIIIGENVYGYYYICSGLKKHEQMFLNVVEGALFSDSIEGALPEGEITFISELNIDGIPLGDFFSRAKRIRVEILEKR